MLIKLDNPKLLLEAVAIISELVTEVRIRVNQHGMSLVAIDPANIALVSFKIPASAFSKFEADNEVLGVNLDNLKTILRRCGPGSALIMKRVDNNLLIEIQDKIKRDFSLALIDVSSEEKTMPELDFKSRVEIDSNHLAESIFDCATVSDACSFIAKDGKFIIESKGLNSARSEFSGDEAKIEAENSKSRYSLEYLQKFIKTARLAEKTVVQFSDEYPLKMIFSSPDMEMAFVLAPRVEND